MCQEFPGRLRKNPMDLPVPAKACPNPSGRESWFRDLPEELPIPRRVRLLAPQAAFQHNTVHAQKINIEALRRAYVHRCQRESRLHGEQEAATHGAEPGGLPCAVIILCAPLKSEPIVPATCGTHHNLRIQPFLLVIIRCPR